METMFVIHCRHMVAFGFPVSFSTNPKLLFWSKVSLAVSEYQNK